MPRAVIPDIRTLQNAPSIAGWRDAMERLNQALGQLVTFKIPEARVWPAGTVVDPETGEPYDPTVVPESGGGVTAVTITATPVFKAIQPEDPIFQGVGGVRRGSDAAVIVMDYDYVSIVGATEFTLFDVDYRLTELVADGLVDIDRYIAYGEAR